MVRLFLSPLEPASSIIRSSHIFTSHICYYFECSLVAVFASMCLLSEWRDEFEQYRTQFTVFFFSRYGRRIPYASFMIFGGLAGTLVSAVPSHEGK